ncbi:MAG: cache domain-containing protein [Bacteroidales bacterium]|nr:cache domain-containing protein [Bacteroidales bacterium]
MGPNQRKLISLQKWLITYQLSLALLVVMLISAVWIGSGYFDLKKYQKHSNDMIMNSNRLMLQQEVNRIIHYISYVRKNQANDSVAIERILNFLADYRMPYGGYIFINKADGKALIFDGKRVWNKSIVDMKDVDGKNLYLMELDAYNNPDGGFMEYKFQKMGSSKVSDKISFVKGYHDFEWMIGAGNYLDDLNLSHNLFYHFFQLHFFKRLFQIALVLFVVFGLVYIVSRRANRKAQKVVDDLMSYVDSRLLGAERKSSGQMNLVLKEIDQFLFRFDTLVDKKLLLEEDQKNYAQKLETMVLQRTDELEKQAAILNEKNKDLESFNYSVSHDLKTPLRALVHYSEFLNLDLKGKVTGEQKFMIDEIHKQSKKMMRLIEDLLRFSSTSGRKLQKETIDMYLLFESIINESIPQERALDYSIKIEPLPKIQGDYALIKQVVINLVSNAFKFSKNAELPSVEVGFRRQSSHIVYFIIDNGVGFSEETATKIFDIFYQSNPDLGNEGTGIGLAIVKRIVEKHLGFVYAKSEGQGAEIGFGLPIFDFVP